MHEGFGLATPQEMTAQQILAELVSIPELPGTSNINMVNWVTSYLQNQGVEPHILPGPEGNRSNLFATIGPTNVPGIVLSGHMDVVPVEGQDWTANPFILTDLGGKLTARGASDMKGFLACVLAMAPIFKAADLKQPVHIAFSYDEEIGCRGVPHLINAIPDLCALPRLCIVGEPSDMRPVLSHKGKQAMELRFEGRSAHSSNPALGINALYPAAETLLYLRDLAKRLESEGPFNESFTPPYPTVVAGVINGGAAVNIIPEAANLKFEVRSVPGYEPKLITGEILAKLDHLKLEAKAAGQPIEITFSELSSYPALAPVEDPDLVGFMEDCSGHRAIQAVSYGTEAGLFHAAGIPSIICGPGSITRAHRPDEYILQSELDACMQMLDKVRQTMR
ncbi:acetylornithine deacetylase [Roseibium sp. HPY-6]|uniref:acetylornithine deacetylase n=1 Tax=Roseibium sp. HPY-6 TaxID=3229852 RepID=UPI00338F596A